MKGEADVGGDVGDFAVVEGNGVHDEFADIFESVGGNFPFALRDLKVIDLEHCHEILGGRSAVDWTFVSVLIQERCKSTIMHNDAVFNETAIW